MIETRWYSEHDSPETNNLLGQWAAMRIFGYPNGFEKFCTMAVFDNDVLVAVMVYHEYDPTGQVIQISGAAEDSRWLTRETLNQMFNVPFDNMGCQMVVMRVSANNARLPRMLTAAGFKSYTIPRLRGRFEDEVIFTLTDDDWKSHNFYRRSSENGKAQGTVTAEPERNVGSKHVH